MRKFFFSLLFIVIATSYVNSQTVVKLLLPNNCSSNVVLTHVENPNSDNDFKMLVSPNPSTGKFVLNLSSQETIGKATIYVYSQLGEGVYTETIYCSSEKLAKQIDLKNLLAGTYIIKVTTETKEISTKLIIK